MIRIVFVLLAIAVGLTSVVAQDDPIATRQNLMKENNRHDRAVRGMVRGEIPFDVAAANAAFDQWSETAAQFGKLFPDNSKAGRNTRAKAAIWQNRSDFDAKLAAFSKAVAAGKQKSASLDGLKASYSAVNTTCNDCHELYRAPAQKK